MKTEQRLALLERQRTYAWELARAESAAALVAGKTHDLLNLVQIVQLAAPELSGRSDAFGEELIADIARAARDAYAQLSELLEVARPRKRLTRGAAVAPVVQRVVAELELALACDIADDLATALDATALEHVLICLALDGCGELALRTRRISGVTWIELVCTAGDTSTSFDRTLVEALVTRGGGEIGRSERRGGGSELIVALPVI